MNEQTSEARENWAGASYDLPAEVKWCTRCVVFNQRPRIVLDSDGVCNACRFAENKNTAID